MPDFEYPRPQLVRDNWICLNGPWDFAFDDAVRHERPDEAIAWGGPILVPFAPETAASGIGDDSYHPCCWYRRQFDPGAGGGRVILHFGAVDYAARVWVNNRLVAEHEGGHTPFAADITRAVEGPGPHVVVVRAYDDPHDLAKPRGKQDWLPKPHSIWYPRTSGIWQTVWLERVPATYIRALKWTPLFENFEIGCDIQVEGEQDDTLMVEVRIKHDGNLLADDIYKVVGREAVRKIALSDPGIDDSRNALLWSPERPTLLDTEVRLMLRGEVIDAVTSYTAMRAFQINRDRLLLNGRPYPLRLVLDQGYWTETLMTAPSDDALRRDVELAKAMGFNGVRKHQKIEDPRYLYWADRLGLLVWEEMPSAYRFSAKAMTRLLREWTEAIERDYSHPCVIVWVPFNESWGVPNLTSIQAHRNAVEALFHLTKMLDSTRPVIGNDGWEASATDILGIHDYDCDADKLRARYEVSDPVRTLFDQRRPGGRILTLDGFPHRGQPIVLTEFGGIAFADHAVVSDGGVSDGGANAPAGVDTDTDAAPATWGYSTVDSPESYLRLYRRLLEVVNSTFMFSGFCYTQFADTFQEANGLLRADRTPKIPLEQISAATRNVSLP
jgi:beta-galactosidase/beta-glucuronidase